MLTALACDARAHCSAFIDAAAGDSCPILPGSNIVSHCASSRNLVYVCSNVMQRTQLHHKHTRLHHEGRKIC